MKKITFLTIFLVLILITNISLASYSTVTMSVVEEPICTINLEETTFFEKKLISKDLHNKEVTLQMQINNNTIAEKPTGEVVILIDNSNSMTIDVTSDKTRKDLVFTSAQNLVTNLLQDNTQLQIGVVSFSTNIDIAKEGTIEDATLISPLSNSSTDLNSAISNIATNGPRTNLDSGLKLASTQFSSEENNKYLIILTDGVPNVAVNYDLTYYSDDVISKTKSQLQSFSSSEFKVITMLTGISDPDYVPVGVTKSFQEIITEIFGTTSNPTIGEFYYITDDKIEETITENIYKALTPVQKTLKDITVTDYFPSEIAKNFTLSYVSQPTKGTISAQMNTTTNSIVWEIPELASGETATVQFKLKLNENFESSIVDKIINTNQKVDVTYSDFDEVKQEKTSDISPKIKLTEPPVVIPKAGKTMLITSISIAFSLSMLFLIKLYTLRKK